MQPKWQRARILKQTERGHGVSLIGQDIWVKIERPYQSIGLFVDGSGAAVNDTTIHCQLTHEGRLCSIDSTFVELLARDESDFLYVDPPLIPWEEFLAECRAAKGVKDDAN